MINPRDFSVLLQHQVNIFPAIKKRRIYEQCVYQKFYGEPKMS